MHETGIAMDILKIVKEELERIPSERALRVRVKVGRLMAVETDILRFALDALKKENPATGNAEFQIDEVPVAVLCRSCEHVSLLDDWVFMCRDCGCRDVVVTSGNVLEVTDMEVQ